MPQIPLLFRAWAFVIGAWAVISSPLLSAQEPKEESPRKSPVVAAVEKVKPAARLHPGIQRKGQGSRGAALCALGVLIDPKGTVLTNHSTTKGWKKSEVILSDGRKLPAKALFSDPDLDLLVLQVEDTKPFPHVEVGDSDKVKKGDWVIGLGARSKTADDKPLLVVAGLIGGKVRAKKKDEFLFRVDTSIGPGCNPGPLITREGKFVGLVVSRNLSPHLDGAVPSNRLKDRVAKWSEEK